MEIIQKVKLAKLKNKIIFELLINLIANIFMVEIIELLNIKHKIGNIVDKINNILGYHKGFCNYKIGQRK